MADGGSRWRRRSITICFLVSLFSVASKAPAECPPWRGASVTVGRTAERLCAKHHEVLLRTTAYGPDPAICILVQCTKAAAKARACSPNALPFGVSRAPIRLYSRAVETFYCNQCETFLEAPCH
jgi:hypothetical protein